MCGSCICLIESLVEFHLIAVVVIIAGILMPLFLFWTTRLGFLGRSSSVSLAFVLGIHQWTVDSPHKGPVTRKMFSFDEVIKQLGYILSLRKLAPFFILCAVSL